MDGYTGMITEQLQPIFAAIRDNLDSLDTNALHAAAAQLLQSAKPSEIMHALSLLLFLNPETHRNAAISSSDALRIVAFLVASDSATYIKPASRAVKDEALRRTNATSLQDEMHVSDELTVTLVSQLCRGDDVEAAQNCSGALAACCRKLGSIYTETVFQAIVNAWKQELEMVQTDRVNASTRCVRCASAVADIVLSSDAAMNLAVSTGALGLFLRMLQDGSDPLLQMSFLDMLDTLATSQPMHHERARWLFSNEVLNPILHLAGGLEGIESDAILGGPALRLVASLCKVSQQNSDVVGLGDEKLLKAFYRALHNCGDSGELDRLNLIGAISSFATASPEALELVLDDPVTCHAWLSLSVAQSKLKSAVLVSVAMVLDPSPKNDNARDSSPVHPISNELGMKLLSSLGRVNRNEDTTEMVISLAKSPLPETRLGAYTLLQAVSVLPTGGQLLFTNSGFYDFLMNREAEATKEGREAKYELVQNILASSMKDLLADDIVRELEKYIANGPHYRLPLSWEVAEH
jgi:Proteasome non-ATPase 26S subunit